jgi:hypothetical protein
MSSSAPTEPAWLSLPPEAAADRDANKALDTYAASLKIDCVADEPAHTALAERKAG